MIAANLTKPNRKPRATPGAARKTALLLRSPARPPGARQRTERELKQALDYAEAITDGQQAIDYLRGGGKFANRARFPFPCLVLLDLKLPHVMGLNVLKWIRQQPGAALVVVMLTASGEDEDITAAYRLGANGFLVKPSQASKLVEMAKAIKDFWLTHNTLPQEAHAEAAQPEQADAWHHTIGSVAFASRS